MTPRRRLTSPASSSSSRAWCRRQTSSSLRRSALELHDLEAVVPRRAASAGRAGVRDEGRDDCAWQVPLGRGLHPAALGQQLEQEPRVVQGAGSRQLIEIKSGVESDGAVRALPVGVE